MKLIISILHYAHRKAIPLIKELEISCSGAPNVASVWINYNYNSELSPQMVIEIDNDKYISANTDMPNHLFVEKYPHIQVMASSGILHLWMRLKRLLKVKKFKRLMERLKVILLTPNL